MAEDAVDRMDAMGLEWSAVFGASMGGMTAQEMAMNHPRRVTTLILGGTSVGRSGKCQACSGNRGLYAAQARPDWAGYLWWCATAVYPRVFIYEHPEIVEKKIRANLAFPS